METTSFRNPHSPSEAFVNERKSESTRNKPRRHDRRQRIGPCLSAQNLCVPKAFLPVGVVPLTFFSPVSSSGKLSLRHSLDQSGGEIFLDETLGDDAATAASAGRCFALGCLAQNSGHCACSTVRPILSLSAWWARWSLVTLTVADCAVNKWNATLYHLSHKQVFMQTTERRETQPVIKS
jgi:hypothetical protein